MRPSLPPATAHAYASEHDLDGMYGLLMEARRATTEWRYAHVGELAFTFFMVDCHLSPRTHIRLWHANDRLVAYAILAEDPVLELQVAPDLEGTGLEEEALAWANERLVQLRGDDPRMWSAPLHTGVREDHSERIAFLERHGFRPGEYIEVNMIRPLDGPIPMSALPAGCTVRAVEFKDIHDRAAAHHEVWEPWTVGNVSTADYERFTRLPAYRRDLDVVAVAADGCIAAYVNGWIDPLNHIGDFGPVGAREAYRRQGYTRAVLLECMRRMRALGMDRVEVSTGEENWPARRLYESVGCRVVNRYLEYIRPE